MKKKQLQELKNMTEQELLREMENTQKKLFELKIQHKFSPVKNPLQIREYRRHIARIKTLAVLNNKKI